MSPNNAEDNYKIPGNSPSQTSSGSDQSSIDLLSYHEKNAGRLIIDPQSVRIILSAYLDTSPREVKIVLGESVASRLKLTKDGSKVLWPQPTDSPDDPQNWSDGRKTIQLVIITLAAIVPDFDNGIGG